jgi:hypothetical protein
MAGGWPYTFLPGCCSPGAAPLTARFPEVLAGARELGSVVLDGELVAYGPSGLAGVRVAKPLTSRYPKRSGRAGIKVRYFEDTDAVSASSGRRKDRPLLCSARPLKTARSSRGSATMSWR